MDCCTPTEKALETATSPLMIFLNTS